MIHTQLTQTQVRPLSLPGGGEDYCLVSHDFVGREDDEGLICPTEGDLYVPLCLFLSERAYSTHWEYGGLYLISPSQVVGEWVWEVPSDFLLPPAQQEEVRSFVESWNSTKWEYHKLGNLQRSSSHVLYGDGMRGSRTEHSSWYEEWGEWRDPAGIMAPVSRRAWWHDGDQCGTLAVPAPLDLEEALLAKRRQEYNAQRDDFPRWVQENEEGLSKALALLSSPDCREEVSRLLAEREEAVRLKNKAKAEALRARAAERQAKEEELKRLSLLRLKTKEVKGRIAALRIELSK